MSEIRIKTFYTHLEDQQKKLLIGLLISLSVNFVFLLAAILYQQLQTPEVSLTNTDAMVILNLQQDEEIKKIKELLEKPSEKLLKSINEPIAGDEPAIALKGELIVPIDPAHAQIVPDALADTGRIDVGIRGVEGGVINGVAGGSLTGTGLGGGDYIPPKLMVSKFPEYPKNLQKKGVSGVIVLQVKVDTTGHVVDYKIKLNTTNNSILEKLAIETVFKCRYNPASDGIHPIMAWTDHRFEFIDKSSQ
jgi:TonB family protein